MVLLKKWVNCRRWPGLSLMVLSPRDGLTTEMICDLGLYGFDLTNVIGLPRIRWTASRIACAGLFVFGDLSHCLLTLFQWVSLWGLLSGPFMTQTWSQLSAFKPKHLLALPLLGSWTMIRLSSSDTSLAPSTLYLDRVSSVDLRVVKSSPSDMPSSSFNLI